jgi:hypothetical protein
MYTHWIHFIYIYKNSFDSLKINRRRVSSPVAPQILPARATPRHTRATMSFAPPTTKSTSTTARLNALRFSVNNPLGIATLPQPLPLRLAASLVQAK